MSEDELVRELADRANKLGIKIDMSIGEQPSACVGPKPSFKKTATRLNSPARPKELRLAG
jgi:hypothetical protein